VIQADVDLLFGPKFLRGAGDQLLMILDYITDVIGQLSGPDRYERSLFEQGNIGRGRPSAGVGGRGRPRRRTADNQDIELFSHKTSLQ
jgi:hypothetical protein